MKVLNTTEETTASQRKELLATALHRHIFFGNCNWRQDMRTAETGAILSIQWSIFFRKGFWDRPSEMARELTASQHFIEYAVFWENFQTTLRRNNEIRTPYSKLISGNFVLKLYSTKSQWKKPQKYKKGREHFIGCVHAYVLLCMCTLIGIYRYCQYPAVTRE
jgi:hypothetical protein